MTIINIDDDKLERQFPLLLSLEDHPDGSVTAVYDIDLSGDGIIDHFKAKHYFHDKETYDGYQEDITVIGERRYGHTRTYLIFNAARQQHYFTDAATNCETSETWPVSPEQAATFLADLESLKNG